MGSTRRVTVTLPSGLLDEVDRLERNRSRFVLESVQREVHRRQREALRRSLRSPHSDAAQLAEEGFAAWAEGLPADDLADLVDLEAGTPVRWVPGEGWVEGQG